MSDERLRELERVWRENGTCDSETALITERLRTGQISRRQLLLAAVLGHPIANAVVGGERVKKSRELLSRADLLIEEATTFLLEQSMHPQEYTEKKKWFDLLSGFEQARARALLASLRSREALLPKEQCSPEQLTVMEYGHRGADLAEAKLVSPHEEPLELTEVYYNIMHRVARMEPLQAEASVFINECCLAIHEVTNRNVIGHLRQSSPSTLETLPHINQEVATRELLKWALGHGDPILERVEDRKIEHRAGVIDLS